MDVHQLRVFIEVAQYLNFTEAAKRLYVAQSAVSHTIGELEKEHGVKLFIRNKSTISLTPAGEILLQEAFRIVSYVDRAKDKMRTLASGEIGKLRFGFAFEPIVRCLRGCFKRFYQRYPEINLSFNSYDSIKLSRMIDNKQLDVGFVRLVTINKKDATHWEPIYTDRFHIVVPPDHRLAKEEKVTLSMIETEQILLMSRQYNPGMYDMLLYMFMDIGASPRIIDATNDFMTLSLMAELGMGVILLPTQFVQFAPQGFSFIPIENPNACHEIGIVWHKDNINPAIPLFLEELNREKQSGSLPRLRE